MSPVPAVARPDYKVCLEHRRTLYGYACKLTRNPDAAADLVQDTFIRALERWDQFQPPADLPVARAVAAWLTHMLRNLFMTRWRDAKRHAQLETRELGHLCNHNEPPVLQDLGGELEAALAVVGARNPLWRQIAEAVWLHDGEYHEVADKLGIPIGTVMSALNRVRNVMIGQLSSYAAEHYGIRRTRADLRSSACP